MPAPLLFDDSLLPRHRARARGEALYLHDVVADDLLDRLGLVKRAFNDTALITGFPEKWAARLPEFPGPPEIVAARDTLALSPGKHDLIIHVLDLHWRNDPVGQLIQCRRALKPDGLFIGVLFGGATLHELRDAFARAESEVTGGLSPRVAPMAELRDMGGLLQRAGFALPVADNYTQTVTFQEPLALMQDLRGMGETNALAERLRRPTRRRVMERMAELYARDHADADNTRVRATFEILTLTGWAPDESQPQPLRPGSATTRLSDVLGRGETSGQD